MNSGPTLLVVKESQEDERRVSLVPSEASRLVQEGYTVVVESEAGLGAGFSDNAYEAVGAKICKVENDSLKAFRALFQNVDIIIRAKRPNPLREKLECLAIKAGTKMIGSLAPLEKNSNHLDEYRQAGIDYYSFDQFYFPPGTAMDALKKMGAFAGKLALEDALQKSKRLVEKLLILGFGEAGRAACLEGLSRKLFCRVITSEESKVAQIQSLGAEAVYLNRNLALKLRQEKIINHVKDVDIIIAAASSNGAVAPLLLPKESFNLMKPDTIIVDLALTEGGNVEGSQPDASILFANQVCVINVSGYPKAIPVEASIEWSKASYYFIKLLVETPELLHTRDLSKC